MDYPKSVPNVGLVDGQFVDENAATGQVGSLIPSSWGNSVTQEILNVIKAAGLVPSEGDLSQLLKAIQTVAASDIKRAVQCATTGAIALSGLQTIDGVALTAGQRVLVKNQANAAQNWIYTAAAGAWVRALDANESAECTPGHLVIVEAGTANAGSIWQLSNTTRPVLGTTVLSFVRMFGKTGVAAGSYQKVTVDEQGRVTGGSNPTTLGGYGIGDAYTKTQVDTALNAKASSATTLGGYGIADAYTKDQTLSLLRSYGVGVVGFPGTVDNANNTAIASGQYRTLAETVGLPNGHAGYGTISVERYNPDFSVQVWKPNGNTPVAGGSYFRSYNADSGAWSAWERLLDTRMRATNGEVVAGSNSDNYVVPSALHSVIFGGKSQILRDVTASRAKGVTYTNSRAWPIILMINCNLNSSVNFKINGFTFSALQDNTGDTTSMLTFVVPAGATYSLSGWTDVYCWLEFS